MNRATDSVSVEAGTVQVEAGAWGSGRSLARALSELAYAAERTTFLPQHLARSGLAVEDIRTADDFAAIPVTDKEQFRLGFPTGVLASGYTIADKWLVHSRSSGTGGDYLTTVELPTVFSARALCSAAVNPVLHEALRGDARQHVRLTAPNCSSAHCAIPVAEPTLVRPPSGGPLIPAVRHDLLTTPAESWANAIEGIERLRPRFYYADPAHMAELALHVGAFRCDLYPAPVLLSYSLDTRIARRQITEAFTPPPPPIIAAVSMSELGWLAVECPAGALHLNTANFYPELQCGGRPARVGEIAELVVTTLDHGCTPRIRYRTRDLFTPLAGHCRCGSTFPMVRMEGRLQDCIVADGAITLTPRSVDAIVGDPGWLDRYHLHQLDERRLRLELIVNARYLAEASETLLARLHTHLVSGTTIQVHRVRYIASAPSGKLATCTSVPARRLVAEGWSL
jgi:phenylacetate-CoA ligase